MAAEMEVVDSTSIEAIGYDEDTQSIYVRFVESGETYVYSPVEEWVFTDFRNAPSKGSFLNRELKGRYEYRKE
jgi:hypothetical protein